MVVKGWMVVVSSLGILGKLSLWWNWFIGILGGGLGC